MTTRNGIVRRPGVAARPTTWQGTTTETTLLAAASLQVLDISHQSMIAGSEDTGTCMRLIGSVEISNLSTELAPEDVSFGIGVGLFHSAAIAALAVPNPSGSNDGDWYYWWGGKMTLDVKGKRWTYDIRSARRLRANYRLLVVIANQLNELTTLVKLTHRTLWKMP